jgi:hypothetical protein
VLISSKTLSINPNIQAPAFQSSTITYAIDTVFTANEITVQFQPSAAIPPGSIITLEAPPMTTSNSLQYFYDSNVLCTGLMNFNASASCVYNSAFKTIRITGAFPGSVANTQIVRFKLDKIYSPVSTSQYVRTVSNRAGSSSPSPTPARRSSTATTT